MFCSGDSSRYGDQKVAEGVDGADLLTLHEQGLMPLDGEQNKDGEEMDDDTEIPRLIAFPRASAASGEEEEMDDDEEEDDEMEGVQGGSKKRARQEGEEQEEEQAEEGMEDDSDSETTKASKKARREGVKDGDVEEYDEGGEDEEEEEEKEDEEAPRDSGKLETKTPRSEKSGVKFASEVKKVDGPGPNGALDGAGPDPRKVRGVRRSHVCARIVACVAETGCVTNAARCVRCLIEVVLVGTAFTSG